MQKLDPKSDGAARDWVAIYDECSRILYEEINYLKEADYARDFAANFKDTPWVKVPEINRDYLSPEVIVMEYVPGVKINNGPAIDEMGLDRTHLATLAVESYLQQLLRHGLFHADPHPGNVAVDAVNGGRLIYYDFGMMGRIAPRVRCAAAADLDVSPICTAWLQYAGLASNALMHRDAAQPALPCALQEQTPRPTARPSPSFMLQQRQAHDRIRRAM